MPFYNASESTFTRHYREEVAMALSAVDCVLNARLAIYASTELTSGSRLYGLLRENGLKTVGDLRARFGREWYEEHVWNANVRQACSFAEAIRSGLVADEVITPAPFAAPGWTQPEYLAFWETLIRTRVSAVWLNDSWQFSNGCTFEFAVAQDEGVPTFDRAGQRLTLRDGAHLINEAIVSLANDGFDVDKLKENRDRLSSRSLRPAVP